MNQKASLTTGINLNGIEYNLRVVAEEDKCSVLTAADIEMDIRAEEAVKAAIHKAKVCGKPVARYDREKNEAYLEYANGDRKYADV